MHRIVGKPVLLDKLDAELAAKISSWIGRDNQRALAKKRARAAEKRANKRAQPDS